MQLLILFLKNASLIEPLVHALAEKGFTKGTILDGKGMAKSVLGMDDLAITGFLRQYFSTSDNEKTSVFLMAVQDNEVITVSSIIKEVIGDVNTPNSGVILTVPVLYFEGIA